MDQNSNKKSETDPVIQQPGEVIAPEVADGVVETIANEVYGMTVISCKQLNGYDDKNYHIKVSTTSSNPHVTSASTEGYVMKIINTMDTKRPEILHAQIAFMEHLGRHGIATQAPVPAKSGQLVTFYPFPNPSGKGDTKTHVVCLRTFLPGQILYDVTLSRDLCFRLGAFQASMTKALQDFHHPFYDTFDCLWSLNNVPKVTEFVHVIKDVRDRRIVDDVIQQFTDKVLPRRSEIRSGYIHGDPNEQNILVTAQDSSSASAGNDTPHYIISGVLDFQDAALTHPLYDLAILTAYLTLQATTFDPLEVGGHVLAGYTSVLDLPELERGMLRVAMAARLVQSLVLGAYTHTLDPDNDYLLTTAQRGWHVLHELWETAEEDVQAKWNSVEQSYTA